MSAAPPVLLCSLPFGLHWAPSLGLSLLKGALDARDIRCGVRYFTLDLARAIGPGLYQDFALRPPRKQDLVGEWIAASGLKEASPKEIQAYLTECLRPWEARPRESTGDFQAEALRLRAGFSGFLDCWATEILAAKPRMVGLTSVFEQTAASLGLARRLKTADPGLLVVLGGANAEGPMGEALFRNYPELDLVFTGESEVRFPAAVEAFLATGKVPRMVGVHARPHLVEGEFEAEPYIADLDLLPQPDFSDFFAQHAALGLDYAPSILFEASRGCWWGQKRHCTFCGLNGETLTYRAKTLDRAFTELQALVARHPGKTVEAVDNILDLRYFKTLLPRLAAWEDGPELFFEVKANLTKEQLRLLHRARVTKVQPGIESLCDGVLALMRKGVGMLQNLQLLKWCQELGLTVGWNILYGFPGEDPAEYSWLAGILPSLFHLQPPYVAGRLRLDRFSPNFEEAEARGFTNVRAARPYGHVFGLPEQELRDLAYFFDFDYADGRDPHVYAAPVVVGVEAWREGFPNTTCAVLDKGDHALVFDTRPMAKAAVHLLEGLDRELLLACDAMASIATLARAMGRSAEELEPHLRSLEAVGLLLTDGKAWLALPVRVAVAVFSPSPKP